MKEYNAPTIISSVVPSIVTTTTLAPNITVPKVALIATSTS